MLKENIYYKFLLNISNYFFIVLLLSIFNIFELPDILFQIVITMVSNVSTIVIILIWGIITLILDVAYFGNTNNMFNKIIRISSITCLTISFVILGFILVWSL